MFESKSVLEQSKINLKHLQFINQYEPTGEMPSPGGKHQKRTAPEEASGPAPDVPASVVPAPQGGRDD